MTRAQLTLLTAIVVAAIAPPTWAQTPKDSAAKDSAAKDSTAPKKSGRFGGLMNRAKQVAGSKAGQTVAKVAGNKAVQGAAMGVACTVVPGAAMVSAATGSGPCQNGLMSGLMSGNALTNAAARLSGNASMSAQAAAIKAMVGGKGGVSGAAAAAAMGALGGVGGVSGMSAAAQASAMKIMLGARVNGTPNAAATAAAMKMLQSNGMSNAAAATAMSGMMQNSGAAQLSSADAAAAMKIIQNMNIGTSAGGATATTGSGANASATPAAPAALWVNYDFVPGDRVIFYTDYSDEQVGNFPKRLQFVEGNMEVAELGGRRVLRATGQSKLTIPLPEVLPDRFTIEIDVINRPSLDGADFHLRGSVGRVDDSGTSIIGWGSDGVALLGGGGGEVKLASSDANRLRYRGKPAQLRILGDGKYIKVYLDEKRMANVPNANFERSKVLHLFIDARSDENPAYIGRIRVAESRKSIYDDLVAAGHVATQGLLFDTGSDQLQPESTPTLKKIAAMLTDHPDLRIRIEGHTDNVGSKDANRALSGNRAASVKAVLVRDYGISAGRLDSKGLGDSKPVGKNDTPEGRQNNRRVELVKL
jgi:outer membrane protein OmpA-like peptidoglycan-associated protein